MNSMEKAYSDDKNFKAGVLIIDYPYPKKFKKSYKFTINFIKIMESITESLCVISGNVSEDILNNKTNFFYINTIPHLLREMKPLCLSKLIWSIKTFIIQLKICCGILKFSKKNDIIIFFMMHPFTEIIPMLFAKILGKKILKVPLGLSPKDRIYAPILFNFIERIVLEISDYYIPEYETVYNQIKKNNSLKHPERLLHSAHFFILEENFKIKTEIKDRELIIAYIGGFREIKGIMNFIKSLPEILEKNKTVKIYVVGDGILKEEVKKQIDSYNCMRIILRDWIFHDELPSFLNKLKLLVIPSFSEGVPNIAIEAMACGTPVLSTNVGVIPMLVDHGVNGFILPDNSPETIVEYVNSIISNDLKLQQVSENAITLINDKYKFKSTINLWRNVLQNLMTVGD